MGQSVNCAQLTERAKQLRETAERKSRQVYVPRHPVEAIVPGAGLPMIFVHTPKCAGSFVAAAFGRRFRRCITLRNPALSGHLTWQEYRSRLAGLGVSISEFVTFSTVRNPWAWHVSWYTYIRNDEGGKKSGHQIEHELYKTMEFKDYIRTLDDPELPRGQQGYITRQISDWFTDEEGKIAVDYVLRTEQITSDFEAMRQREHLWVKLPRQRLNVSNKKDFRKFYDSDAEAIVRSRHARDIAMFDYKFE